MNFTPAHVHEVNNKSRLMAELKAIKRRTRERRKVYWEQKRNPSSTPFEGEGRGKGPGEMVDPGANTEGIFKPKPMDSRNESPTTKNDLLVKPILSH